MTAGEREAVRFVNYSDDQLRGVKREINTHGRDAKDAAVQLMRDNRVLALGENHILFSHMRRFGASLMQPLRDGGATHLAVEMDGDMQETIDKFNEGGPLDREAILGQYKADETYLQILRAARDAQLKIVCVDAYYLQDRGNGRDQTMANSINAILDADPKNKVVFWVGYAHLERGSEAKNAADLIRERHSIATVAPVDTYERSKESPLSTLSEDLRVPVALSIKDTPLIAQMPIYRQDPGETRRYAIFDNVFIVPNKQWSPSEIRTLGTSNLNDLLLPPRR